MPFFRKREEISTEFGCLLWDSRVIVPSKLQHRIINELHEAHPGMVRMKALARSYVWWPGLDDDIVREVRDCLNCQQTQRQSPSAVLHPWKWCTQPFQRVHIDFAEKDGKNYFVAVDSFSKWPEIAVMNTTTASKTIDVLRATFARFGLPEEIVSNNGPQFISEEFATFYKRME
ncbi:hypothetical protein RRG08_017638 [Elysia crispata]|uniref:Integrase catalytic domain-containing protein n=1 Tax=Elysia crispata TaxID=231223 RepID=A0AAE0ZCJ6_9GAST|nr:hypothetical protein RRG08_017638 [Elysia crispata]